MSSMFLNPRQPLATCSAQSCDGCPVSGEVHCHFKASDLTAFLLTAAPSLLIGGSALYRSGIWWLAAWLLVVFSFFGLIEIRVMCSHCPHYAEPGKSLQCWANYGSPRLWKYRPGPMSSGEKAVFFGGLAVIWGSPIAFQLAGLQWFSLLLFVLTSAAFFATLRRSYCSQCMNFACPLNHVDVTVRAEFFKRNPVIAQAWASVRS